MKRIYISGQITGNPLYKVQFAAAARIIKFSGFEPINPAQLELGKDATWTDYMRRDLKLLCDCDSIYMLKNWKKSKGAKLEHEVAKSLGLSVHYER